MDKLVALLGPTLQNKEGMTSTEDALAGKKAIGLYFSAHWCPPCRQFTPMLGQWYEKDLKGKGMEIVFISSDRDEESFNSYYKEQAGWLSLPYAARDLKNKISKKFKVSGIPSFVILDGETGETITTDGREAVSEDPTGKDFPWKPPSFWDSLGSEFLQGDEGDTVTLDEVKAEAKYIGLYFSAHWCPPCKAFTPSLVKAYNDHLKPKGLEIIFVSSDRDQKQFMEYFGEMPWLAIPPGDKRKGTLSKAFGVSGIPTFVIVDVATGQTITTEARGNVSTDPEGAEFPWHPKALCNMSEGEGLSGINDETALCVMLEGCDEATKAAAKAALEPIAEARKTAKEEMLFFYAPVTEGPTSQVRQLTKLAAPTSKPQMLILDIPDSGGFYTSDATEVTTETITAFLDAYKGGKLERKQLG